MHAHHAIVPEQLDNGGEESLVKYYWQTLQDSLTVEYPWDIINWQSLTMGDFSWRECGKELHQLQC